MSRELFLLTLGYFMLFVTASYGLGSLVLSRVKIDISQIGIRLMIGLALIGNIGLVMALAGKFERNSLILILTIIIFTSYRKIIDLVKYCLINIGSGWKLIKSDWFSSVVLVFAVLVGGSLYLAAMAPPHATDELHYHFPQARTVAEAGKVGHSWDGHYFYGNIPKLGEMIFSEGLLISDYSLAHALNYLVLAGFLILVFGVIKRRYGYRAAVFSITLLLLFEDLTWNSTVGFVDSMTTAMEVGSLLLVADWVTRRKDYLLTSAGLLLGLGLGIKYSPLPTALYLSIIILLTNWRKILVFGVPAFVVGGYWYLKNWIMLGNPFYPMYFGHRGVGEETYQSLMNAIWQWEPKTLTTFMNKLKRWWTYSGSTTYVSIWLAPLAMLIGKRDKFLLILTGYYLLFVPYWFFLATHQTRFLLTGLVVASILTGILLSKLPRKLVLIGLVAIILISLRIRPYPQRNLSQHYLWMKMHTVERQYALGNVSEREYLTQEFGCQYEVIKYLEDNKLEGEVIDNWSVWHDPSVAYFGDNNFVIHTEPRDLEQNNIRYLYRKIETRKRYLSKLDPIIKKTKEQKILFEDVALKNSEIVFEKDGCELYLLDH